MIVLHTTMQFVSIFVILDESIDLVRIKLVIEDIGCWKIEHLPDLLKSLHHYFKQAFLLVRRLMKLFVPQSLTFG